MNLLGLLQLLAIAFIVLSAATAALTALTYPRLRQRVLRLPPARGARVVAWLAALPTVGALALVALCLAPKALALLVPALDHCLAHGDHPPHICFVHLPAGVGAAATWVVIGGLAALAGARLLWLAAGLRTLRRALRALLRLGRPDPAHGFHCVAGDVHLALATDLDGGRVIISRPLADALPPDDLAAVLAHERAHLARRDPRTLRRAALLSALHLPVTRRLLLADLTLATERAADEVAASAIGSRARVARALLTCERLAACPGVSPAPAFHLASTVPTRVRALLDRPRPPGARWPLRLLAGATVAAALSASGPLHHAVESLLDLLVGG